MKIAFEKFSVGAQTSKWYQRKKYRIYLWYIYIYIYIDIVCAAVFSLGTCGRPLLTISVINWVSWIYYHLFIIIIYCLKLARIRKDIIALFKEERLSISIETNLIETDFLDVTFNFATKKYFPFPKANNTPL